MYGICKHCGCTNYNHCYHPDYGTCWWIDPNECNECSHCTVEEIKNDPATEHCINDNDDL